MGMLTLYLDMQFHFNINRFEYLNYAVERRGKGATKDKALGFGAFVYCELYYLYLYCPCPL